MDTMIWFIIAFLVIITAVAYFMAMLAIILYIGKKDSDTTISLV